MRVDALLGLFLLVPCIGGTIQGQSAPKLSPRSLASPEISPVVDLEAEEGHGPYFFYTQQYRSHGKLVSLNGSFYAAITSVHQDGCKLSIATMASDHFAGRNGRKPVPDTWARYRYSVQFELSLEMASKLRVFTARPVQLQSGTYAQCDADRGCTVPWLEIRSARPELRVRSTTDDVADYDGLIKTFDGMTTRFLLPVSSPAAGERLVADLQDFAQTCRNPSSTQAP